MPKNRSSRTGGQIDHGVRPSSRRIKLAYLLVKWEGAIDLLTVLCAVSTFGLGVMWLFIRESMLLYIIGLNSSYLIGKRFWKYRGRLI